MTLTFFTSKGNEDIHLTYLVSPSKRDHRAEFDKILVSLSW